MLSSNKFDQIKKDGQLGFYDKQEGVFIPNEIIPSIVKEMTTGPYALLGSESLNQYFDLCQVRVRRSFQKRQVRRKSSTYKTIMMRYLSMEFLNLFVNSEVNFAALYIDLVGSTLMSIKLSSENLSTLIDIFTNEMSSLVMVNQGFILKYAGDAVIAFFPNTGSSVDMTKNALRCAFDMRELVSRGINTVLEKNDFDPLKIRIGIESGSNKVVKLGGALDIIGSSMNMAAKVTSVSRQNGIAIGENYFLSLDEKLQADFTPITLDEAKWKYKNDKGLPYQVYELLEQK